MVSLILGGDINLERFWGKVDKTSYCWNWKNAISERGYGIFMLDKKTKYAHRVSWTIFNGDVPNNLMVLHKCDNRKCVNPEHLFVGTARDNTLDMISKNRHGTKSGGNELKPITVRTTKIEALVARFESRIPLYINAERGTENYGKCEILKEVIADIKHEFKLDNEENGK